MGGEAEYCYATYICLLLLQIWILHILIFNILAIILLLSPDSVRSAGCKIPRPSFSDAKDEWKIQLKLASIGVL